RRVNQRRHHDGDDETLRAHGRQEIAPGNEENLAHVTSPMKMSSSDGRWTSRRDGGTAAGAALMAGAGSAPSRKSMRYVPPSRVILSTPSSAANALASA